MFDQPILTEEALKLNHQDQIDIQKQKIKDIGWLLLLTIGAFIIALQFVPDPAFTPLIVIFVFIFCGNRIFEVTVSMTHLKHVQANEFMGIQKRYDDKLVIEHILYAMGMVMGSDHESKMTRYLDNVFKVRGGLKLTEQELIRFVLDCYEAYSQITSLAKRRSWEDRAYTSQESMIKSA